MSVPEIALEARGLTKRYRDGQQLREVVRGVNLALPRGALWVLRGPSGSGKSTLLGMLAGLLAPSEGEVELLGRPLSRLREHHRTARRREAMGCVFQNFGLLEDVSVLDNTLLPAVPQGGPNAAQSARARELLTRFGLAERLGARASVLSGGERQRVAIARALLLSPSVLILDEPTAHLDADHAQRVTSLLAELRDEGQAVLATTHDPRLALDPRVDRQLGLVDGVLGNEC